MNIKISDNKILIEKICCKVAGFMIGEKFLYPLFTQQGWELVIGPVLRGDKFRTAGNINIYPQETVQTENVGIQFCPWCGFIVNDPVIKK